MTECTCKPRAKHAIYGKLRFNNGNVIDWLQFIEMTFTLEAAKIEAARIVRAQHNGDGIAALWAL